MTENANPEGICPDLIEFAEECYRLAQQVEQLESHIAAIEDGLDDELTTA